MAVRSRLREASPGAQDRPERRSSSQSSDLSHGTQPPGARVLGHAGCWSYDVEGVVRARVDVELGRDAAGDQASAVFQTLGSEDVDGPDFEIRRG